MPKFAPYVTIVDVSRFNGTMYEGQRWDVEKGEPILDPPAPTPDKPKACPVTAQQLFAKPTIIRDVGIPAIEEMGFVGNVWVRKHFYENKGDVFVGHKHFHDHILLVMEGAVMLQVEGTEQASIHRAPTYVPIFKNFRHQLTAEEDGTVVWCVFALRDLDGNVTDIYNEDNRPYAPRRDREQ